MLGDKLRTERERQGLTVKDIEKGTSIRAHYIECIEKGEYESLPGEVYTKGFIRNYATFLKLDAKALVGEFNEERHPEAVRAEQQAQEAAQKEEKTSEITMDSAFGGDFTDSVNRQNKILAAVVCLLVLGGAYFLFSSGESQQVAQVPQETKQVQPAVKKSSKAEVEDKPVADPARRDDVEVVATFEDRCWTQVIADGKTLYEGTMEKGETMSWKAQETVSITAGNAGAVALSVNGKDMGKAGEIGQVVEKVFTPGGEKKEGSEVDKKDKDK